VTPASIRRLVGLWGILAAGLVVVTIVMMSAPYAPESLGPGHDARAYWAAPIEDPYSPAAYGRSEAAYCWTDATWDSHCYRYSPAFLLAFSPLQAIGWQAFVGLWASLMMGVLFWMTRSLLFLPALLIALPEIWGGNITILLAAAIVLGFTRPWAWALPLLTKVTPGVGLIWYAVRREWLNLAVALAGTVAVIGIVATVTPGLWQEWYSTLLTGTSTSTIPPGAVPIPLLPRLPLAVAVIVIAAWRGERWLLPIGILLAMPVIWWGYVAILVASIALKRADIEERFDDAVLAVSDFFDRRLGAGAGAPASST
jgi:hypothetical protein